MEDNRMYYQPWGFSPYTRHMPEATGMSNRVESIISLVNKLLDRYKNSYSGDVSKSKVHCELFKLRELGENSIHIMDDTYRGGWNVRNERPQLCIEIDNNRWKTYRMIRQVVNVKFELPFNQYSNIMV